jgi:hypothetical protein
MPCKSLYRIALSPDEENELLKRSSKCDGFVKSRFCSLRVHFGRTRNVQLKC